MTQDLGHFGAPPYFEEAEEPDLAHVAAELEEAQMLYSSVVDPAFDAFLEWVVSERDSALDALIVASSIDRVNKLQGRVRFAEEILSKRDSLAADIRALQGALQGGTDAG